MTPGKRSGVSGWARRLVLGFLGVKLLNLLINLRTFPVLQAASAAAPVGVSLLVPMRNEADTLALTMPGLLAQQVELIILDDCSTDDSAAVARRLINGRVNASVITGTPQPNGWVGKTWACEQLGQLAGGDVLVFCDADVLLADGAVTAVLTEMRRQQADLFSVFPRQMTGSFAERVLIPFVDDVLLAFLPFPLLAADVPSAATANGSLMAFRKDTYDELGGFATVKTSVVDDLLWARTVRRHGHRLGLALGGDLVQTRMYDGYRAIVIGFGRGLRASVGGSRLALGLGAAVHLAAYTVPFLLARRDRRWRAAIVLALLERLLLEAKTGRRCWWEAVTVPLAPIMVLPVVAQAMRRSHGWKGRTSQ